MDRRGFLGLIGCGAGAVVLGPLLPASEPVGFEAMIEGSSFIGIEPSAGTMARIYGGNAQAAQRYYNAAWNQILDHVNMTTNPIAVHKDDYVFFANE